MGTCTICCYLSGIPTFNEIGLSLDLWTYFHGLFFSTLLNERSSCNSLQDNGLVPIVEPEILLDGDHPIERTLEVAEKVWSEVFFYLAQNNVLFEGILLKPSMVTPGAEHKEKASPETIAKYTLTMLKRRVPPAVPGIMVQLPHLTFCFLFTWIDEFNCDMLSMWNWEPLNY